MRFVCEPHITRLYIVVVVGFTCCVTLTIIKEYAGETPGVQSAYTQNISTKNPLNLRIRRMVAVSAAIQRRTRTRDL